MSSVPTDIPAGAMSPALGEQLGKQGGSKRDRSTLGPSTYAAILVALAYFLASCIHDALPSQFASDTAWSIPNATLLTALVLSNRRHWWVYLAAVLVAHLIAPAVLPGVRLSHTLMLYLVSCGTVFLGALALEPHAAASPRFDSLRSMAALLMVGLLVPLTSGLLASELIPAARLELPLSSKLARTLIAGLETVTLLPLTGCAATWVRGARTRVSQVRVVEAVLLALCVVVLALDVFVLQAPSWQRALVLVYAALPLMLWAALRFGSIGTSSAVLLLAATAQFAPPHVGAHPTAAIVFLIAAAVPLLLLAASLAERRSSQAAGARRSVTLHTLFRANPIPTLLWAANGRIKDANAPFFQLTGYTRADLGSSRLELATLAPSRHSERGLRDECGDAHGWPASATTELDLVVRDGRRIPALVTECRIPGTDEGVAFVRDLTPERNAEAVLRQSERFHSAIMASLHDRIVVVNAAGIVIETNESSWRSFASATIRSLQHIRVGQHFLEACDDAARGGDLAASRLLASVRGVLAGLRQRCRLEFSGASSNPAPWFEVSVEPLRPPQAGAVITCADITERKQATMQASEQRKQLAHLGRAAVLGELSGALAHELNQPLTSILGNAEAALQLLSHDVVDLHELREILNDIIQDDVRAAEVIQRLRSMLSRGEIEREPIDLDQIVRDVLELAHSDLIGRNVSVTAHLDSQLHYINADRVQLQQVVLNLLVNACEAMDDVAPAERKLTVTTQLVDGGRAVECSVADQGHGLAASNVERVFHPFVTTKQQGLGLGLAICRSIIESHGGRIWAENSPRAGAIFHFTVAVEA